MTGGSLFAFGKSKANVPLQEDFGEEWWTRLMPQVEEDGADGNVYKTILDKVLRSQHRERAE
eukprot:3521539-Rhodomonas_salina.1